MSLKASVQIAVKVSAFRTMGICESGDFYWEIKFYIETQNAKYYANPKKKEIINKFQDSLRESRIINNDMLGGTGPVSTHWSDVYHTQILKVEYNLDEWNLNEMVHFNHEIDLPRLSTSEEMRNIYIPLIMEVMLFKLKVEENEDNQILQDYEQVSVKSLRVGDLIDGIFKAVPVVFDAPFSWILSTSVFASIQNLFFSKNSKMKKVIPI